MRKIKYIHDVARLRELFTYDSRTGIVYRRITRHAGKPCGTLINTGHLQVRLDKKGVCIHRIAWALYYGEYPSVEIDHINGDGADNRIVNLRLATSAQNNQNRRLSARNKAGVKGVFRVKRGKPWRVCIGHAGGYYITQFDDFDEAVAHAAVKRREFHSTFANDGRTHGI